MLDVVRRTAEGIYMPLTVGGGVRALEDIRTLLRAGADKVSLNTAALARPALVSEAARAFGSQCIVVAIDAKREPSGAGERWGVYTHGGRRPAGRDAVEWAREVEQQGAGEILLTSMDRDGTGEGYDLPLTRAVSEAVSVPVIASGGAGTLEHLLRGRHRRGRGRRAGGLDVPLRALSRGRGQGLSAGARRARCGSRHERPGRAQVGCGGAHPRRDPGNRDRRGAHGGLDEPGRARRHPPHRGGPLLVPLAPAAVAQGRDLRPRPARGRALRRLRSRHPPGAGAPGGRGLPYRRALLLLHARGGRRGRRRRARARAPRPSSRCWSAR